MTEKQPTDDPVRSMTEQERADLQVWLRFGRIGVGRTYQQEVARAYEIEAKRNESKVADGWPPDGSWAP